MPRDVIEAFSTRRAEIEAAMKARGFDDPGDNKKLADRAALMTRAHKRDVDKGELRRIWSRQASELEFSPETVLDRARGREAETSTWGTQGRGRYDRDRQYDKPKKDVWLRPLRRDWKRTLNRRAASKSLNDDAFTVKRVGAAPEANSGCALPHGTWPTS